MNNEELLVPDVEGKTIRSMRYLRQSSSEIEILMEFVDGTSFAGWIRSLPVSFGGELFIGGNAGEPQILKRYGDR